jgi:hypothetical protein
MEIKGVKGHEGARIVPAGLHSLNCNVTTPQKALVFTSEGISMRYRLTGTYMRGLEAQHLYIHLCIN